MLKEPRHIGARNRALVNKGRYYEWNLWSYINRISCHPCRLWGAKKTPGLTVEIPYGGDIGPDGQVVVQISIPVISATGKTEVGMTTVGINASGDRDKIIAFYDKSYSDWESLTGWETRKILVSSSGGVWKGWKRDDTYAIIAVSGIFMEKTMVSHSFGAKYHYDELTKDRTNRTGLEQPATPTPSP